MEAPDVGQQDVVRESLQEEPALHCEARWGDLQGHAFKAPVSRLPPRQILCKGAKHRLPAQAESACKLDKRSKGKGEGRRGEKGGGGGQAKHIGKLDAFCWSTKTMSHQHAGKCPGVIILKQTDAVLRPPRQACLLIREQPDFCQAQG